ncbi:MAG: DUF3549 family protein [Gammaproteobacteria bacterium]|nr:DUF3549 family protein [Gammaproteobacteria bacterium]
MEKLKTLIQFLQHDGAEVFCFDLGRRITPVDNSLMLAFERTEQPYPYPLQQQAWFGLLIKTIEPQKEPLIWFLRFPLDEQGKLLQAARDDFMQRLIERLGTNLKALSNGKEIESALDENPYSFKPRDERLAIFHANATRLLDTPASKFYDHAREYFNGSTGWDQWSFVGYQGIADVAARVDIDDNQQRLVDALPHLPPRPLEALCHCLENQPISSTMTQSLLDRLQQILDSEGPDSTVIAALLRGVGFSTAPALRDEVVERVLTQPVAAKIEILAAISGRCWESLHAPKLSGLFVEALAGNDGGQNHFDRIIGDLLFIPGMREPLLTALRDPERSDQLREAIGSFFGNLTHG